VIGVIVVLAEESLMQRGISGEFQPYLLSESSEVMRSIVENCMPEYLGEVAPTQISRGIVVVLAEGIINARSLGCAC